MKDNTVALRPKNNNLLKLSAVSLGHFINDFYMTLIPPILFIFTEVMSLSLTQQAVIAFIITSSGTFLQPIIGYLVDKQGKPWLLIVSIVWISFWMSISGIVHNYYLLLVVLALAASASALYHPLGSGAAISLGTTKKGTSLSIFMTIGGFAAVFPPLIALPVVQSYGLDKLSYFMVPGLLTAIFMYFAQVHKIDLFEKVKKEDKKNEEKKKLSKEAIKWLTILVVISTNRFFVRGALISFGIQLMIIKEIDVTVAGFILSAYLLFNSAGTILGGLLNDVIGSKKVIMLTNIGATIGIVLLYLTSGITFIAAFVLIGFILSGGNTSNVVMTHDLIPENTNFATGLILGLSGGLGGLGILLYGRIADAHGLLYTTALLIIPLILGDIITMLLPNTEASN